MIDTRQTVNIITNIFTELSEINTTVQTTVDKEIQQWRGVALVSDDVVIVLRWVIYSILCTFIVIFGTVTNIFNIICFVKQGFQDSVNTSLLGLAVSDLCSLLCIIVTNICYAPSFDYQDLYIQPIELQYLIGSWPHVVFTRITSWITAFTTLERCLCIIIPLKVKSYIPPRRVKIIIVCIYIAVIASVSPVYYANRLGHKFSAQLNRTIFGLIYTDSRDKVEAINFIINNVTLQFAAFSAVIIFTIILVVKLRSKTKWRTQIVASKHGKSLSNRDNKVIKMVVVISTLFIACFTPLCLIIIAMIVESHLSLYGRYRNMLIVVSGVGFVLECTNSSVNIFIYYFMSSKYRAVFRSFVLKQKQ